MTSKCLDLGLRKVDIIRWSAKWWKFGFSRWFAYGKNQKDREFNRRLTGNRWIVEILTEEAAWSVTNRKFFDCRESAVAYFDSLPTGKRILRPDGSFERSTWGGLSVFTSINLQGGTEVQSKRG